MNFENLLKKMQELDTPANESMQPPVQAVMSAPSGPEYPDEGEISLDELMALKKLLGHKIGGEEGATEPQFNVPDDDVLLGNEPHDDTLLGEVPAEEEWANEPKEKIAKIAAVIGTGNDLASKGKEAPKVNGGGNPMQESLIEKLSAHYNEIKSR